MFLVFNQVWQKSGANFWGWPFSFFFFCLHLYLAENHHHHFALGLSFILFLEPRRCSKHAWVSWFLQPSRHLSRSCASNLCKPPAITSHSSTSFYLFFGLPFLSHQLLSVVPLLASFFIHSLHMPPPSQPLLYQKLFQSLNNRHLMNLPIVYFIFRDFSTYNSKHSHFCSLQLPFIFHSKYPTFRTIS